MTMTLKEKLTGAWQLVSYVEKPLDGSPDVYPMGDAPMGLILYTPDGYMSAQLMKPNRTPFASGDWFSASPQEFTEEGSTYIAYSGRFYTDEAQQTLSHSMFVSLYPNWTGQTQQRAFLFEGALLKLSSPTPILSGGKEVIPYLTWKRAEPNAT
ncbi:lipocalin-like domain-containing protein [Enterobacteriaceae bacterium BIT-l23]|uniref:Lipocalin-like domain-containing protein n=1 Tax=Jejubacter calystegiae TaxID=2579935 RepID=A0A4P8YEC5_9ENTR|nr:lipocalin-like domain-containing protein [Jejubacter calystegiae]NUU65806.1 lipocalin-like domain-containing protein [Enterobacteriaceae bacterium BIT-l23]QCT18965.1 lipocalin-like domain-containing protein [Jejubacter calystegiae]